jgi:hypothetical protein
MKLVIFIAKIHKLNKITFNFIKKMVTFLKIRVVINGLFYKHNIEIIISFIT